MAVTFVWLLLAGSIGPVLAQSVQPQKPAESEQHWNPADQHHPTPSAAKGQLQGGKRTNQKDDNGVKWTEVVQTIGVVASLYIAWLIYGVYDRQAQIMRRQMVIASSQALIMRRSADTLPKIERAYVFAHPIMDNFRDVLASDAAPFKPKVKMRVSNDGKTPAELVEVRIGLFHQEGVPDEVGYADFPAISPRANAIASNTPTEYDIECREFLSPGEFTALLTGRRRFYVQGQVLYKTVVDGPDDDQPHETTFCWRYDIGSRDWREWGGKKYNKRT